MWLNLGSGDHYADGWVNVDFESPHRTDQAVDLTGPLPWEPATAGRAYLGHVLEHLPIDDCSKLLYRLREVVAPGGEIMVVGPDVNRAAAMNAGGTLSDSWLRLVRDGANRWPGDQHLWLCEPETLMRLLVGTGWSNVQEVPIWLVPDVWPLVNRVEWQCAVSAVSG